MNDKIVSDQQATITLDVKVEASTYRGLLIRRSFTKNAPRWISRAMIKEKFPQKVEPQRTTITVPVWLATKIGLIK
jgi:hypothetical protein